MAKSSSTIADPPTSVAVIIAAYNAAETIGKAITSALAQPETAEVVVVDDASVDGTSQAAYEAAGGDPRLAIIRNEQNLGPSASRNTAIRQSSAPFIAILDGDDFFLDGRFGAIFRTNDWDFCADNIVFFADEPSIVGARAAFDGSGLTPRVLDLSAFIRGNIPNAKKPRGELGFLKPVMRRSFIEKHALTYEPSCRLGEDFVFYTEALIKEARYLIRPECGYAALVRPSSLSGQHSLYDLQVLHSLEKKLALNSDLLKSERRLLEQRCRSTRRRVHHREVLAIRRESGLIHGLLAALMRPTSVLDIYKDRFGVKKATAYQALPRLLLPFDYF